MKMLAKSDRMSEHHKGNVDRSKHRIYTHSVRMHAHTAILKYIEAGRTYCVFCLIKRT